MFFFNLQFNKLKFKVVYAKYVLMLITYLIFIGPFFIELIRLSHRLSRLGH